MSAVAAWQRTMASARPKFREPEPVRDLVKIRAQRIAEQAARLEEQRQIEEEKLLESQKDDRLIAVNTALASQPIARIRKRICKVLNVRERDILKDSRSREIVFARQAIMYWAARLTDMSYPDLGRRLGGRDHTTVMHGAKKYVQKRAAMGRKLRRAR